VLCFGCLSFFAEGLAWDWINEKLYWTDYCQDEIEVYDPVSNYRRVLLSTGTSPYSIVVDPGTG
jgi:DNA-binding beta-propeller fold protein YncE